MSSKINYYPTSVDIAPSSHSNNAEPIPPAPISFPFDIYKCYQTRLISFINGAIYCLGHQVDISTEEKNKRILDLHNLAHQKSCELDELKSIMGDSAVNFGSELYYFYTNELPRISGLKPKQIALAEAFYVWQEMERKPRSTLYYRELKDGKKLIIEQQDITRETELTDNQKKELLKVHSDINKQPKWFRDLDAWAQHALKEIIPNPKDDKKDWSRYQKYKPSTLRHIPGEANATQHMLTLSCNNEVLLSTKALRQGVPTSFNMKNDQDRQNSATENVAQMITAKIQQAKQEFEEIWGPATEKDFPILLSGLVTPAEQAGLIGKLLDWSRASGEENNTKLAREKEEAFNSLINSLNSSNIKFFNLNVGINILSKPVKPDAAFIKYVKSFLEKFSSSEEESTNQRKKRIAILKDALTKLETLASKNIKGRNRNIYLAALYDVTIRVMGGLSTGNCKSSKDRKGAKLMLADSMLIYAEEQTLLSNKSQLPAYDAQGEERERYANIVSEVYASGHQFLIAHDNSPGSPGIKDEGFIDEDIVAKLHTMQKGSSNNKSQGVFALSKQVADFNKPGTFWQKFGPRIKGYATIIGIVLLTIGSIACIPFGVSAPIGIIGLNLAAKLGAAAFFLNWVANIFTGSAVIAGIVGIFGKLKDFFDSHYHNKNTFENQKNLKQKEPISKNLIQENSTDKINKIIHDHIRKRDLIENAFHDHFLKEDSEDSEDSIENIFHNHIQKENAIEDHAFSRKTIPGSGVLNTTPSSTRSSSPNSEASEDAISDDINKLGSSPSDGKPRLPN